MARITESDLILPSLYLMTLEPSGKINTPQLISKLTSIMHPTGIDAEILAGRNDTYFSQKVRNLKSHNTLTRKDFAKYFEGIFEITDIGRKFVEENIDSITYLISSGFKYEDLHQSFGEIANTPERKRIPFEEIIQEGNTEIQVAKKTQRSRKLRNAAIDHFTMNGRLVCDCCGFCFEDFYGVKYACNCIEIHHIKPIFQYQGDDEVKTIEQALQNLLPVCPNCHRVIHRHNIGANELLEFKETLVRK